MNLRTYNGPKINDKIAIVSNGNFITNIHLNSNYSQYYDSNWEMYKRKLQFGEPIDGNWSKFKVKLIKSFIGISDESEGIEYYIIYLLEKRIYTTITSDNFKKGII